MMWRDRTGRAVPGNDGQDKLLEWLYGTALGRSVMEKMIQPKVTFAAEKFFSSRQSALLIRPFRKMFRIDMSDYEDRYYFSFNDFFTRRLRPGARPVDMDPMHLIAPCDGKLTVCKITKDTTFRVKGMDYTLESLLRYESPKQFEDGILLLFRLTAGDYHRYCYIDSGYMFIPVGISGVYHTVNPAAASRYPIYKENSREYIGMRSDHFGSLIQMEVGATLVGRISNKPGNRLVQRGEEKGHFEFGGSTVILILQKDTVQIDEDILKNSAEGVETVVKYGEKIGVSLKTEEEENQAG